MNEVQATMPLQPANTSPYPVVYGSNNNGGFGDGNNGWWVIILLLALGRGWGGNGFGGGGGSNVPYIINTSSSDSGYRGHYDVQDGFNHAAVMAAVEGVRSSVTSGNGDTQLGIAGLGRQLCETGANVTAAVTGAASAAEIAANQRAMAAMERSFAAQTATDSHLDNLDMNLQKCCCDNQLATESLRYTVATENAADRAALSDGIRDIIANQTAGTQRILDQLCQDKIDQKDETIANLRTQLNMAGLQASQVSQTAQLISDNTAQTQTLINRIAPYPQPAYLVGNPYGYGYNYGFGNGNGWGGFGPNPFGNVGFGNGTF